MNENSGQITDFAFNKGGTVYRYSLNQIPAVISPDGQSFEVTADFKADVTCPAPFFVTCGVEVMDPDGNIYSPPHDRAGISPGETLHNFGAFQFPNINTSGVWTSRIWFYDDDGTLLALWGPSALFTAEGNGGSPSGEIMIAWVNKSPEGNYMFMPAVVSADGNTFEIVVRYVNRSTITYTAGCEVVVKDPDGIMRASPPVDYTGMSPNEVLDTQYNICAVDKAGDWTVVIRFITNTGVELDRLDAVCLSAPGLTGVITGKWIDKAPEGRQNMPADINMDGNNFEVGFSWENTCITSYDVMLSIVIRKPDGDVVKSIDSSYYGMGAGQSRENNWDNMVIDMVGSWTVSVELITRDGLVLDSFQGVCMVVAGYAGSITSRWFNQGSHIQEPFSTHIDVDGQNFEVGVKYKNIGGVEIPNSGVRVEVWDPDGLAQPTPAVDYTGISPGEELTKEYQFGAVDKAGEWITKLSFITEIGDIIDEWEGILFNANPPTEITDLEITTYYKKATTPAAMAVELIEGDILVVGVSFKYTVASQTTIQLFTVLLIEPGEDYPLQHVVQLPAGTDQIYTGEFEMPITSAVGLTNDTYHVRVRITSDGQAQADNAVIISGMPSGVGDIFGSIGSLILMMIVMMMMQMMQGFMEDPVGSVGRGAEYIAEKTAPIIQVFTGKGEPESE